MKQLHWLKVQERIDFKTALLVHKALNNQAPLYISELVNLNPHSGVRTHNIESKAYHTRYGNRSFQVYAQ